MPASFNPETGENIKWTADLGSKNYSSPIVAEGCVFIGANNASPRDPRHEGDRAILLCLEEQTGRLRWQLVCPRLRWDNDIYLDWPQIGMCSPPTVENGYVYVVTNRFEVVCLDIDGMADGNDGPFVDEGRHMVPEGDPPLDVTPIDADIVWLFDLPSQAPMWPHDGAHIAILIDGNYLYLNSGNGVDNTHKTIRRPEAPGLIVLDKRTGEYVARDYEQTAPDTFHSTWSPPAMAEVNGVKQVFFCGGNGVVYSFRALPQDYAGPRPAKLELLWKFDFDPSAPKEDIHSYLRNRRESPSNILSAPVFYDNRLYVTGGGDIWWGKEQAWLKCIDPTGEGDVTDSALLWSYELSKHCCSTVAIRDDLLFVADCGRLVHCLDANTGKPYWTHEMRGDAWGSTLVADGKVYVGSRRGDFWIFQASKEK
ncbi:MAG: pyrrolo-quinoline quinone, partial [Planctomycetota bacterium]